jgi:hypothetical protein
MLFSSARPKGSVVKVTLAVVAAAAVFASSAAAAGMPVPSTVKDMKTAVRGVAYPKPHPKKLSCKGQGPESGSLFSAFRCVSTYKHHQRRVFFIQGQDEGGWLCAGKTLAGCKLLRKGFVTTQEVNRLESLGAAADLAARGYLDNHGLTYQPVHFCQQAGTVWACPFTVNNTQVTVTVSLKKARGGYVISATDM